MIEYFGTTKASWQPTSLTYEHLFDPQTLPDAGQLPLVVSACGLPICDWRRDGLAGELLSN
jgi:hypothetical protein